MKKILILVLFFLLCTHCGDSMSRKALPGTHSTTPTSASEYKIVLGVDINITVSYSPLYADNVLYSVDLSQKGECLIIRSDYLNSISIIYDKQELCDNADASQNQLCGSENVSIFEDNQGLYIDNKASTSSYNNCDLFLTDELKRRIEDLRPCIDRLPTGLNQSEDMRRSKECTKEVRGD